MPPDACTCARHEINHWKDQSMLLAQSACAAGILSRLLRLLHDPAMKCAGLLAAIIECCMPMQFECWNLWSRRPLQRPCRMPSGASKGAPLGHQGTPATFCGAGILNCLLLMRPLQHPDEDANQYTHHQKAPEDQELPEGVPALRFVQGIYLCLLLFCSVKAQMTSLIPECST